MNLKGRENFRRHVRTRPQLEVMSKGVHVFTMMDNAHLEFEIQVDLGRGYVPAEENERYIEVVGTIPMDAIFTPISKVKYAIEPCRVGQRNDYDKLVMEIWTDGSISPEDALAEAAKIAKIIFRFLSILTTVKSAAATKSTKATRESNSF